MKSIREIFLPNEDEYFVKLDLSQAEDRFAKMYCNSQRMRELANTPPWEFDVHTENARLIFGKEEISKDERYLGKKVVHAAWRGMGGNTMSEAVIRDTKGKTYLTPQKCNSLIKRFLDTNPEIKGFYFPWVEKNVREGGVLFNSWGRRYDVRGLRVDMSLLQACYSFYPQAENADWTNQYGVIPAHHFLTKRFQRPLSLQVHDEIVASLPFEGLYEFCVFAKNAMEQTRVIQGHPLKIPVEIKISDTLYGGIEFQQLPTKDKFEKQLKDYFKV